jgi:hypothetical protein
MRQNGHKCVIPSLWAGGDAWDGLEIVKPRCAPVVAAVESFGRSGPGRSSVVLDADNEPI